MQDKIILHSFRRCPFAMRVRIVLALKKIDHVIVEERLRDWSDWMLENVMDPRVPILRHGDKIIRESNVINEYLDHHFPEPPLILTGREQEMFRWMTWWDQIKPWIDQYKYGKTDEEQRLAHQELTAAFRHIESALTQTWLLGTQISLADIAIIPFVRQVSRVRPNIFDFSPFPGVVKWMERVTTAEWFNQEVMKKYSYVKKS